MYFSTASRKRFFALVGDQALVAAHVQLAAELGLLLLMDLGELFLCGASQRKKMPLPSLL